MKKLFSLSLTVLVLSLQNLKAQSVELRPMVYYTFQESFPYNGTEGVISDGTTYGGELGVVLQDMLDVNFTYLFQATDMFIRGVYNTQSIKSDVNIANYQLGINHQKVLGPKDNIKPYAGFKVGVMTANFDQSSVSDRTRMSVGLNLGAKIMFTEKVGINLNALLQMPVYGFGIAVGTGGASATTYSYVTQLSLGGGLVFNLR